MVERTFSSINTLFCQHVVGYTGRDTTRRGRDVAGQAVWSLTQLQDLFDQWVLAGWQTRPHDGLRHPELPRSALSPNEMYAAQIAAAGYLPLALSGSDYLELLPVAWRTINAAGIRVGSLTYDCAGLNPYRGQPSAHRVRRGKWPVHHDPYDLGQVWVRRPDPHGLHPPVDADADADADAVGGPAGWIEVPWIHRGRAPAPFADFTLRHTRRVLADRGDDQAQHAFAEAHTALLTRAETGPETTVPAARAARRIAAKTRSAGPSTPHPAPSATARHLEAVDGCDNLDDDETDEDTDDETGESPSADAVVVPFGVFDAHAEAKRFW